MEKAKFINLMNYLFKAYGKDADKDTCTVWYELLSNNDYEDLKIVVKKIISTSKYLPSIAEIKKELERIKNPELQLSAEEEWGKIDKLIYDNAFNIWYRDKLQKTLHPLTYTVCRTMGFDRLDQMGTDEFKWARKEFIEIFNNKKDFNYESIIQIENKEKLLEIGEK